MELVEVVMEGRLYFCMARLCRRLVAKGMRMIAQRRCWRRYVRLLYLINGGKMGSISSFSTISTQYRTSGIFSLFYICSWQPYLPVMAFFVRHSCLALHFDLIIYTNTTTKSHAIYGNNSNIIIVNIYQSGKWHHRLNKIIGVKCLRAKVNNIRSRGSFGAHFLLTNVKWPSWHKQ